VIKNSPILKKQLAAAFMLSLFLFIHGLKLLHSIDHHLHDDPKGKKELVSSSKHCDICDYHFSKDAIKQNTLVFSSVVQNISVYSNFYQSKSIRSIGLSYSDRGPPASI
jgi:hypothetical protein